MKTYVYVDGFNLYYGALKHSTSKWLNLVDFCRKRLPQNNIAKVKYFTAKVNPRPGKPDTLGKQKTYLRALATLPICEIILGKFYTHNVRMPLVNPSSRGSRMAEVIKTEEKGSDVNLASHLLLDGFNCEYDVAVVISDDSDLVTPVRMVKENLGKPVWVFSPNKVHHGQALKRVATYWREIRASHLARSQFPNTITVPNGVISKPASW